MNHNWYAVITAKILMDKTISSTQKLIIALISNLTNERGYCFASNNYLGDCLNISECTVSRNISDLVERKYLGRVIKLNEKNEVEYRSLMIIENQEIKFETPIPPPGEKGNTPPGEKGKENNKLINNTLSKENLENSNLFRKPNIPKIEEVARVFLQQGGTNEMAEAFFNKWHSVEWFKNGSPITNFSPLVSSFITNWKKLSTQQKKHESVVFERYKF